MALLPGVKRSIKQCPLVMESVRVTRVMTVKKRWGGKITFVSSSRMEQEKPNGSLHIAGCQYHSESRVARLTYFLHVLPLSLSLCSVPVLVIPNRQSPIANHQSPKVKHQKSNTKSQSPITKHQKPKVPLPSWRSSNEQGGNTESGRWEDGRRKTLAEIVEGRYYGEYFGKILREIYRREI